MDRFLIIIGEDYTWKLFGCFYLYIMAAVIAIVDLRGFPKNALV